MTITNSGQRVLLPTYERFLKEVVDPLHSVLVKELRTQKNPQTMLEIDNILAEFEGLIVKVTDLPHSVEQNSRE